MAAHLLALALAASTASAPAKACEALEMKASGPASAPLVRLKDLPDGVLQNAVLRRIDACPVLSIRLNGREVFAPFAADRMINAPARYWER